MILLPIARSEAHSEVLPGSYRTVLSLTRADGLHQAKNNGQETCLSAPWDVDRAGASSMLQCVKDRKGTCIEALMRDIFRPAMQAVPEICLHVATMHRSHHQLVLFEARGPRLRLLFVGVAIPTFAGGHQIDSLSNIQR